MPSTMTGVGAWLVGAAVAGALALAGCAQPDETDTPGGDPSGGSMNPAPTAGDQLGSVSMQLTLAGGFRFHRVDYDISGNGFHRAASVDVSGSSTFSTVVGGIPFGQGYVVQLTTQDVDQRLSPCVGSASFDITSAAIVAVPVDLSCHELPPAPTPPVAVPLPRPAIYAVAILLLVAGAVALRRRAT